MKEIKLQSLLLLTKAVRGNENSEIKNNPNPFDLMMNYFGKRFEGIEKKLQQPSNEKAKSLANILFGFPVREPQVNITASPPPPPPRNQRKFNFRFPSNNFTQDGLFRRVQWSSSCNIRSGEGA